MARYAEGSPARKRWGPYADSLPWAPSGGDSGESDPMAFHPFMSNEIDWMRSSLGPKYYQCKAAAYNVRLIVADAVIAMIFAPRSRPTRAASRGAALTPELEMTNSTSPFPMV